MVELMKRWLTDADCRALLAETERLERENVHAEFENKANEATVNFQIVDMFELAAARDVNTPRLCYLKPRPDHWTH